HSKIFLRLSSKANLLGIKPVNTFLLRRTYNTEYTEGTHHVPNNPLDELLNHLESTKVSDPRTIVKHLNDYVIGQDTAKKTLAVAVFNHYNRVRSNLIYQHELQQQDNENIDNYNDSKPHAEHHHPALPSEYYTTNSPIQSVGPDLVPAERMPSYDKWSQRRNWENPPSTSSNTAPHSKVIAVTGDKKKVQLSQPKVTDDGTVYDKSNVMLIGPTGSGKTLLARTLAQVLQVPFSMSDATPFTQAGYVGEDVELVIQRLLQACDYDVKKAETGIVFIDEIDKISRRSDSMSASRDVSGEGVQQSLLRMLEGTIINVTDKSGGNSQQNNRRNGMPGSSVGNGQAGGNTGGKGETYAVDTSNILFILSGAFVGLDRTIQDRMAKGSIGFNALIRSLEDDKIELPSNNGIKKEVCNPLSLTEPADLVKYGLIPEFVGRLPVISSVNNLSADDLVRVLTEPKNSLLKQYQGLFQLSQVDLRFSKAALRKIAELALEKKTGARGLRRIMENLLLDPMYETPSSCVKQVIINSKVVCSEKKAIYLGKDQRHLGDKIIALDDEEDTNNTETLREVTVM
ncbi:hypothetical protein INT48_001251, partial [Thamnidium elegans]